MDTPKRTEFEQVQGTRFRITSPAEADLLLKEVNRGAYPPSPERMKEDRPFALIFTAEGAILPQSTYTLEHDQLGTLEIFLVPVSRRGNEVVYEAVFN